MSEETAKPHKIPTQVVVGVLVAALGFGMLVPFLTGQSKCLIPFAQLLCLPPPPCPDAAFGWSETVDRRGRDPRGEYMIDLKACETLWFNSGSVVLESDPLGGDVVEQNTVLLYEATEAQTIRVGVGNEQDIGHEWWAVSSSRPGTVLSNWQGEAFQAPNCGGGCARLFVVEYRDNKFIRQQHLAPQ